MVEHYSHKIQNVIQKELFKAQESIKIAVAWFTNDLLFQPLLLKLQAGVKVEIILNRDEINDSEDNEIDFNTFVEIGGILHWNESKKLMHEKFCIIDDNIIIYGSYNWTNRAEQNIESVTISKSEKATTDFYLAKYESLVKLYPSKKKGILTKKECKESDKKIVQSTNSDALKQEGITNKIINTYPYNQLHFHYGTMWYGKKCIVNGRRFAGKPSSEFSIIDYDTLLPILPYDYEAFHFYGDDHVILKKNGLWGLYDVTKRKFVVEPKYMNFSYSSLGVHVDNGYYKKGLCDKSWNEILECVYESFSYKEKLQIFVVKKDSFFGVVNKKGQLLVNCIYDTMTICDNILIVSKYAKYGVTSLSNEILVACQYDSLEYCEGKIIASLNNKYGIIDINGNILLNFDYEEIKYITKSSSMGEYGRCYLKKDGKYGSYSLRTGRVRECISKYKPY